MRKIEDVVKAEAAEIELYISLADDDALNDEHIDAYIRSMEEQRYNAMKTGARLKWVRERLGLTQREVAAAMGVAYQTVCTWECGKSDISLRDAHRLMSLYRRLSKGDSAVTMIYSSLDSITA